jgi:hypothetical protein
MHSRGETHRAAFRQVGNQLFQNQGQRCEIVLKPQILWAKERTAFARRAKEFRLFGAF